MGWRLCVLFGYKFEAVRDILVEVFGKVVYKYKKLREVWVEEKQLEDISCLYIVIEVGEVDVCSEKCRELEIKFWGLLVDEEIQQEFLVEMRFLLFLFLFKCIFFESIS